MEERGSWLLALRRENERQENALGLDDPYWSEIEPTHRAFVERFLAALPPRGRVLDAACGIGGYLLWCSKAGEAYSASITARTIWPGEGSRSRCSVGASRPPGSSVR